MNMEQTHYFRNWAVLMAIIELAVLLDILQNLSHSWKMSMIVFVVESKWEDKGKERGKEARKDLFIIVILEYSAKEL